MGHYASPQVVIVPRLDAAPESESNGTPPYLESGACTVAGTPMYPRTLLPCRAHGGGAGVLRMPRRGRDGAGPYDGVNEGIKSEHIDQLLGHGER